MLEYYLRTKYSLNGYDREISERKLLVELNQYNNTKINSLLLQIEQDKFNKLSVVPETSDTAVLPFNNEERLFVFGQVNTENLNLTENIEQSYPEFVEELLLSIDISGSSVSMDISNNMVQRILELTNRIGTTDINMMSYNLPEIEPPPAESDEEPIIEGESDEESEYDEDYDY